MFISWIDLISFLLLCLPVGLFLSISNLLNLLIISELIWIFFYVYSAFLSSFFNSIFIFLVGLYVLSLAVGETTIGLSLLLLRVSIFGSITNIDNFNFKNYYVGRRRQLGIVNSRFKYK